MVFFSKFWSILLGGIFISNKLFFSEQSLEEIWYSNLNIFTLCKLLLTHLNQHTTNFLYKKNLTFHNSSPAPAVQQHKLWDKCIRVKACLKLMDTKHRYVCIQNYIRICGWNLDVKTYHTIQMKQIHSWKKFKYKWIYKESNLWIEQRKHH